MSSDNVRPPSKRRIAVVGPFPPIRSGIAKHTDAIFSVLGDKQGLDVRRWGFSRQYPRFLYPGESERGPTSTSESIAATETLDGAIPWTWARTAAQIKDWAPDLVVLPVWTFAVAPALGWVATRLSRAGIEVCMVVHNAFDHEASALKNRLTTWQLGAADRFVTHNAALADAIKARFSGKPVAVFPHPTFDDVPDATGALPKRSALELLFFGLVRPYKGLDVLLDALDRVTRTDIQVTIAGEFWVGRAETEARIAALNPSRPVELIARYVDDAEMAELFHRADTVVLPYKSVSGSGVVALAFNYATPILASDLPGFSEIVGASGAGWLFPVGDASALAARIDTLEPEGLQKASEAARTCAEDLTWARFADVILDNTP